jgi:hypothetical protein
MHRLSVTCLGLLAVALLLLLSSVSSSNAQFGIYVDPWAGQQYYEHPRREYRETCRDEYGRYMRCNRWDGRHYRRHRDWE